jgi:hypothetical protein
MHHVRTLALCSLWFALVPITGCELILDFDRSKIPVDAGTDAAVVHDAAASDAAVSDDAGDEDAAAEAERDQ